MPTTFALLTQYRFGWTPAMIGITMSASGIGIAVVQIAILPHAARKLGEARLMRLGLTSGVVGLAMCGLTPVPEGLFVATPFLALWGLFAPTAQSLLSQATGPQEQGRLQGMINGLHSLASLIAAPLFNLIFAASISTGAKNAVAGSPFFLAAMLMATALYVLMPRAIPQEI